jgi:hypothetical protein
MAEVVLPVAALPALHAPPLCALTGRPATKTKNVTMVRLPPGGLLMLLGGFLPMMLLYVLRPTVSLALPVAPDVGRRRALALVGIVAAFVLFVGFAAMSLGTLPDAVCGIGAIGSVLLSMVAGRTYVYGWVGGGWTDETHIRLVRLDPVVAEALSAQAASLAL